jgi:hypothetical protein
MWKILAFTALFCSTLTNSHAFFGDNKADDSFAVKKIEGKTAMLTGTVKDLKVGDTLYFVKNPYQFTVTEIKGKEVSIALPDNHSLVEGSALLRKITPTIKKNIDTESKLKQALEE